MRAFPLWFGGIRAAGQARWDISAIKNFQVSERTKVQFRAETFNAWNHPNLNVPNRTPTSTAFGIITGQDQPRSWQLSLKVMF